MNNDTDDWLQSTRILCIHVVIMSFVGALLMGKTRGWRSPAWTGAALVAICLAWACNNNNNKDNVKSNHVPDTRRWIVVMACHYLVIIGIVGVIVGATSIWWVLAASAVALLLTHIQHSYGGCILHDVERIFGPHSLIDGIGFIFVPGSYDPSDRNHAALVTGGMMACTLSFAIIKILIIASKCC